MVLLGVLAEGKACGREWLHGVEGYKQYADSAHQAKLGEKKQQPDVAALAVCGA